jgi:hypothetical protein
MHKGWYNPRNMAMCGGAVTATAAQFPTIALFNNSAYAHNILVTDWQLSQQNPGRWFIGAYNTNIGGTVQTSQSMFPNISIKAGVVTFVSEVSETFAGFGYCTSAAGSAFAFWPHDYPFMVLSPGWSLIMQNNTPANSVYFGFQWAWVTPAEFEPDMWIAANLALGNNG